MKTPTMLHQYNIPHSIRLSMPLLRRTLREVQAELLSHGINGGSKRLSMQTITATSNKTCGMAACIGGWASLFLLGYTKTHDKSLEDPADGLFSALIKLDEAHGSGNLNALFHHYSTTYDYDEPNVAATAIKRYLDGNDYPWPNGEMPNVMPYTKRAYRKRK